MASGTLFGKQFLRLVRLRRSGAEVKREAEAAGNQVRVMTVHGAKGLQAPLVILPDTTALPPDEGPILWAEDPATRIAVPLFSPRKEFRCLAAQRVRDDLARRRLEEHNRLLYVALTRAEDRLVVCGWQTAARLRTWPVQPRGAWFRTAGAGASPVRGLGGHAGAGECAAAGSGAGGPALT